MTDSTNPIVANAMASVAKNASYDIHRDRLIEFLEDEYDYGFVYDDRTKNFNFFDCPPGLKRKEPFNNVLLWAQKHGYR